MLLGLMLATTVALPHPAAKKALAKPAAKAHHTSPHRVTPKRDRFPSVRLFGAHVNEALAYRPHDDKGRARRDASRELQHLLRCRQTGQQHKVAPLLAEALYQIGRHYEGHRLEIYSGYRPRAYCSRTHSRHMTGSAVDFHVEGVDNEALVTYLRKTFHPAGVGYYPTGVHVHLDLDRHEDTYWVDRGPPVARMSDTPSLEAAEDAGPAALPMPPEAETEAVLQASPEDGPVSPDGNDAAVDEGEDTDLDANEPGAPTGSSLPRL